MDVFYCYSFNQVTDREDLAKVAAVQPRSNGQHVDVQHENNAHQKQETRARAGQQ